MGDTGTELLPDFSQNKAHAALSAAESGAISANLILADAQLAEVVAAWPMLNDKARRAILNLVRGRVTD
jgi:hypothetical protein